ncbi:protein RibT [Enterococcus ureilyticus]|uniref:Protein RibT n=1 Tax=Enterococcus ureilyticus TaxID=1131292 RepID=A0A1E5H8L8_9ENTE|nr:GNAT family N-acetyltransferase [Enterococcus ureilyticus]MBM7688695.1 riboflavin biosynthesis RibT protein [Enterococcus ureilyticus]OEG21175.1 protein RibT [Enterococcus ureilyticus]
MLNYYRKEQRKIALGLLSFHQKMTEYQSLLKELDMYESEENLHLLFWVPTGEQNIQGIIGFEIETSEEMIIHDISINPSFRGEKFGFDLLDEVVKLYPETKVYGTLATSNYLSKWKEHNT